MLEPLDPKTTVGIDRENMPRHVAIIMDGNGRWANSRGLPRIRGHAQGATVVNDVVTQCARLDLEALTLYSFSLENWRRPRQEVDFLMELYGQYLIKERGAIVENNVRLVHIGRRNGLPEQVLREMDATLEASKNNTGLKLCLALNYGSRSEIVDAVRRIAAAAVSGGVRPDDIDESAVSNGLYTAGLPDPDLVIRTAGEHRVSNFLLWQISYAELYVCEPFWPDFTIEHLHEAFRDYARRTRRFGAVEAST